jgi:hypothetical protein
MKKVYHHFLVEHQPTISRTVESKVDDICFHLMPDMSLVAQNNMLFELPKGKYLILNVSIPYCRNDSEHVINIALQITQDRSCMFSVAPNARGPLPITEREVYKARFMNLGFNIVPFVGMENAILGAHSSVICEKGGNPQIELFKYSDPFLCFMKDHKTHFPEVDILQTDIPNVCAVSKQAVGRVQSFFKEAIFPLFEYSDSTSLRMDWTPQTLEQQPTKCENGFAIIMVLIKVEYIVIKKEVPKFVCKINNLGI